MRSSPECRRAAGSRVPTVRNALDLSFSTEVQYPVGIISACRDDDSLFSGVETPNIVGLVASYHGMNDGKSYGVAHVLIPNSSAVFFHISWSVKKKKPLSSSNQP